MLISKFPKISKSDTSKYKICKQKHSSSLLLSLFKARHKFPLLFVIFLKLKALNHNCPFQANCSPPADFCMEKLLHITAAS